MAQVLQDRSSTTEDVPMLACMARSTYPMFITSHKLVRAVLRSVKPNTWQQDEGTTEVQPG